MSHFLEPPTSRRSHMMREPLLRMGVWWYEVLAKPMVIQHSESGRMWVTDIIPPIRRRPGEECFRVSDSVTLYRLNNLTG